MQVDITLVCTTPIDTSGFIPTRWQSILSSNLGFSSNSRGRCFDQSGTTCRSGFPSCLGLVILAVCAAIWPLARAAEVPDLSRELHRLLHLQQSFSILRILFFLLLAGCSQLLSLDWRDRELQIATGLGIYSMVSVAVSVLHARPQLRPIGTR